MQQSVDVLHVDDEPTFAEMATTFLERENENFIMHTATSAEEGREILADHDIDCIVSDYDMPGTDGIEFLEYVREEYPDLPFILFTGKGSEEVASEALTKGATDYLQKEVGTDHYELLANRIQNAVDKYQATKRAAELDRVRNLASTINQTLIRAKSREEIETRVCEIISDAEPYLFAWIGDVDPDTDHITPRASAGIEEQYLDEIMVTADETATGQGPGGTAIRERRVAVSQDVADDPEFEPWRDAALERGFRAVAAVPLEYEETLYGELVVYAERSYAFDDDEQDLLAELGDDIAHAIHGVQTQKQLREERDRRQALFENAPGPVIVGTVLEEEAHHRIVEVNEAFEDVFGYQAEEVIDRPVTEVIVPEEGIATYEEFREQALAGETVTAEVERITADGPREFLLHIIPYGTEDDRVHGTYAWFTDITERKEREQKLHRYKRAMDEAPVGITISDPDQEDNPLIYVNDRFEELTGYDEAAIIGRNCRFLQGEQTESEPVARMRESIDATEPVTVELRNYRNDGSMFWNRVKIAPVEDENGTVTNFVGFQENITERKAREKQLKQYKTLVETVGDAMYSVDADGYIEMVNSAMLEYLEIDRETVIGSHISQYMADDDFERVTELIEELVEDHNRAAATMEFTAITATGAEIPAELNIAVLTDESGTYQGNVGVVRDITKRKEREQQLQQERDRLSALFENLGEPVVETTFDEETAIIENVNSSFEEVFGVTEHNIIGEPLDAKIVPEENYESARALTRHVKEGGVAER
ncbi:MAG: PAS domain S-box protein, partial [Halobacteriaceae archaeon]